ncbi:uncharacterized protein LOC127795592 isoform X2 [Diospyros lotus]|uniref:uncharacterized protein LOC127795592 isoform X2 n=1 Tax=Diospyros lotus TaxID=55363 RepID=UPI00224FB276|nr:uncharacterized protein LOC127795592 isoform X2 [Diospyros lotus]
MEPQKKGVKYVYKLDTGKGKPEADSTPLEAVKKVVSRGYWGLGRSKTYRENREHGGGRRAVDGGGEAAEGRKSVSHVETDAAAVAAFLQVKVLVTDMPGWMQVHAFRCARRSFDGLDKFSSKHMAFNIKKVQ